MIPYDQICLNPFINIWFRNTNDDCFSEMEWTELGRFQGIFLKLSNWRGKESVETNLKLHLLTLKPNKTEKKPEASFSKANIDENESNIKTPKTSCEPVSCWRINCGIAHITKTSKPTQRQQIWLDWTGLVGRGNQYLHKLEYFNVLVFSLRLWGVFGELISNIIIFWLSV